MNFSTRTLAVLAAASMTAAPAMANANIKLLFRSDYINIADYKNSADASVGGTSLFQPESARLYMDGAIGANKFVFGINLRAFTPVSGPVLNSDTGAGSDGTYGNIYSGMTVDKFVDHLYYERDLGFATFKGGRIITAAGGFELEDIKAGNSYWASLANSGSYNTNDTAYSGIVANLDNASGLSFIGGTEDHKVTVQVTNQTNSSAASYFDAESASTSPSVIVLATKRTHNVGAAYRGSFMDKAWQANVSYFVGNSDTTANSTGSTPNTSETYTAAGVRGNVGPGMLTVEYLSNESKSRVFAATADSKSTTTSTYAQYSWNMNEFTPVVRFENSQTKTESAAGVSADPVKRTAYVIGTEFKPVAEDDLRYHLMYATNTDKFDTAGEKDVTFSQITLGVRWVGDILK